MGSFQEDTRAEARAAGQRAYDAARGQPYAARRKAYVSAYNTVMGRYYRSLTTRPCACSLVGIEMPGMPMFWSPCQSSTAGDPRSIFATGHVAYTISGAARAHLAGGRLYHRESPTEVLTPMQLFARLGMLITEEQFLNIVERIRRYRFQVDGPEDYLAKVTARWAARQLAGNDLSRPWGQHKGGLVLPAGRKEGPTSSPSTP